MRRCGAVLQCGDGNSQNYKNNNYSRERQIKRLLRNAHRTPFSTRRVFFCFLRFFLKKRIKNRKNKKKQIIDEFGGFGPGNELLRRFGGNPSKNRPNRCLGGDFLGQNRFFENSKKACSVGPCSGGPLFGRPELCGLMNKLKRNNWKNASAWAS